jgi:hypothetical protein
VPDGDHVTRAGEEVDLAEVDLLLVLVVVGGPQDDEDVLVVVLDLRALVGLLRVLDCELVQAEQLLELFKVPGFGLVNADPDEVAGSGGSPQLRRPLRGQRLLVLAHTVLVVGGIDDHRAAPRSLS